MSLCPSACCNPKTQLILVQCSFRINTAHFSANLILINADLIRILLHIKFVSNLSNFLKMAHLKKICTKGLFNVYSFPISLLLKESKTIFSDSVSIARNDKILSTLIDYMNIKTNEKCRVT